MIRQAIRWTLPLAAALLATAANASITYSGSLTPIRQYGSGTLTVDYSITTDGTFGTIYAADFGTFFQSYTLTFNYNGVVETISSSALPTNTWPATHLVATATDLSMDFTRSASVINQFTLKSGSKQISFSSYGNEILGPSPHTIPLITAFYGQAYAGYVVPGTGLQVIGTANVPEPADWAMLVAGFGLTGAVMRRRAGRIAA